MGVMRKVCHLSVSMLLVSDGDVLFSAGEIPAQPKMYFACRGYLSYTTNGADVSVLKDGGYISEGVLWTPWMHQGVLTAVGNARLCILDSLKFQNISGQFEHPAHFDPRAYAKHFVRALNAAEGEITDMFHAPLWKAVELGKSSTRAFTRGLTRGATSAFGKKITRAFTGKATEGDF